MSRRATNPVGSANAGCGLLIGSTRDETFKAKSVVRCPVERVALLRDQLLRHCHSGPGVSRNFGERRTECRAADSGHGLPFWWQGSEGLLCPHRAVGQASVTWEMDGHSRRHAIRYHEGTHEAEQMISAVVMPTMKPLAHLLSVQRTNFSKKIVVQVSDSI